VVDLDERAMAVGAGFNVIVQVEQLNRSSGGLSHSL